MPFSHIPRDDTQFLSMSCVLIFGLNTQILKELQKSQSRINTRAAGDGIVLEKVVTLINDMLHRLRRDFAKNLSIEICVTGEKREFERKFKGVEYVVVSTPGMGPDASGGYTFEVMGSLQVLRFWGLMFLAYDWAGSTNNFSEDKYLWDLIFVDPPSTSRNIE